MSLEYSRLSQTISRRPLLLVDEISHRVVNEYTEAICALRLVASTVRDSRALIALTSAANRLLAQVEAHRALQAPIEDGSMELGGYVRQLCGCLARAPLADCMRLTVTADEIWLDAVQCWRIGLVVAELVRNAARHGRSGGASAIWVMVEDAAGQLRCSVIDDGSGSPGVRFGRGSRLVQALAAELGGSVDWTFAPSGCCAVLEFLRPPEPGRQEVGA